MSIDSMIFTIPKEEHEITRVKEILSAHPEVKFVSFVGVDLAGHDTDAKIPIKLFLNEIERFFKQGVQTDGSSVALPGIADLNNAKVDIIPDPDVDWHVDYNLDYICEETGFPVGTLRIPSILLHNQKEKVGARVILKDTAEFFREQTKLLIEENPYVLQYLDIESVDEIERIIMTGATELEFWVKTPEDKANREQLLTSQELKEQYWQRTRGDVRSALEKSLIMLDKYNLGVEMGHKETGGVQAKMGNTGKYNHIMEQLEIDWKYSSLLQTADNEIHVKYLVKDIFRSYGLKVSYMAKPITGIIGSGCHTHMGVAAELKDGRTVNLFSPRDMKKDYLTPIGFGALMGLLKNYEVLQAFIASTNDALARLKPGFEAPVCIVTSLGQDAGVPSRNRTVLIGLVRDEINKNSTRFELRSPNPKSDTYLVLATAYLAMLDGIRAALKNKKTPEELLAVISKKYGEETFYLEKDRIYRSEEDVYTAYSQEERDLYFGTPPETVFQVIQALEKYPEKMEVLKKDGIFNERTLASYKTVILDQWAKELHNRIIPTVMDLVRDCKKLHEENKATDLDLLNWEKISSLRNYLGQDHIETKCLLTRAKMALDEKEYELASDLQIEIREKAEELSGLYLEYKKNLF